MQPEIGIAAAVLTLAVVWVLLVPAADWLAHHDVSSAKGSLLPTARDAARGRLLTLGAGLFAAGALLFTALTFNLSRRTFEQAEQGQVTDRYTRAIDQLGSDTLAVRIGGIYALERIARDSPKDHPTVMEVLTAFIRGPHDEQQPRATGTETARPRPNADVQAAITVIGRRNRKGDIERIDLSDAYLKDVTLSGDFSGTFLPSVNLSGGGLAEHGHLREAFLLGANLSGGWFVGADLVGASLSMSNLSDAHMGGAYLEGADLSDAIFTERTELYGADLKGAYLLGRGVTNLAAADLARADLTDAVLAEGSPIPDGWQRDDVSGRLSRTNYDPGATGG